MANSLLRDRLDAGEFFIAPGVPDMLAAHVARSLGFDTLYGSGYWLTASSTGLPDVGLVTYTQMLERMSTLVQVSGAVVIADADTGFGGLLNVAHTVRGYEAAGVSAIQIEDQEFPKKCGHTPGKRLIPAEEMARKIRVACDAREDDRHFLVIARSDARQGEGLDSMLRRLELYAEAGADILFPEALHDEEEMRRCCSALETPMLANMAHGGVTPILPADTLAEIGFACAIFPAMTSLAAAAAYRRSLQALQATGSCTAADAELYDFRELCSLIGFEEVWAFERKWAERD
ncbi:MAG: isocitrate lyase/PEP mutase family protein [Gammaproteobacteria bacterium]|nr:isocitrate lyase/PEP mutase family protein [Gammaproteobacteria bacterium]TVQ49364.1 MAG: carboxyvinyl-carboxyphosphonate phosphorylmutase [Gammaproteobacteria bacterium]